MGIYEVYDGVAEPVGAAKSVAVICSANTLNVEGIIWGFYAGNMKLIANLKKLKLIGRHTHVHCRPASIEFERRFNVAFEDAVATGQCIQNEPEKYVLFLGERVTGADRVIVSKAAQMELAKMIQVYGSVLASTGAINFLRAAMSELTAEVAIRKHT